MVHFLGNLWKLTRCRILVFTLPFKLIDTISPHSLCLLWNFGLNTAFNYYRIPHIEELAGPYYMPECKVSHPRRLGFCEFVILQDWDVGGLCSCSNQTKNSFPWSVFIPSRDALLTYVCSTHSATTSRVLQTADLRSVNCCNQFSILTFPIYRKILYNAKDNKSSPTSAVKPRYVEKEEKSRRVENRVRRDGRRNFWRKTM